MLQLGADRQANSNFPVDVMWNEDDYQWITPPNIVQGWSFRKEWKNISEWVLNTVHVGIQGRDIHRYQLDLCLTWINQPLDHKTATLWMWFPQDSMEQNQCWEYPHCTLNHYGIVTPYGDRDLGQHWLRQWHVAWRYQGITWTNVDWSSVKSSVIRTRTISQAMHLPSVTKSHLKIKWHSNFPGANELSTAVYIWLRMIYPWKSCRCRFHAWMSSLPSCGRLAGCWGRLHNRRSISSHYCQHVWDEVEPTSQWPLSASRTE